MDTHNTTEPGASLWDQFHYKAFISYSRDDKIAGARIQKQLEAFKIPKVLRGQQTGNGPVPSRIAPVFRDISDLDAHGELKSGINDVLGKCAYLVVLCSPSAAQSHWVNKEIETFIHMGGGDRIVAILVDGRPQFFDAEDHPDGAFPPALAMAGERGQASTPAAPDIRPRAEGFEFTILKTAAAIIGVTPDILSQRVAERERREKRVQRRIAGMMSGLAAIAAASSFLAFDKLYESEARRSIALAGRAAQSFADAQFDQALMTATAALPDASALVRSPSTPEAEYAVRRAAYFNRLVANPQRHESSVFALAVSPDGKTLVSGDRLGQIKIGPVDASAPAINLEGHICGDVTNINERCAVTDIAFTSNGDYFASASLDRTLRVWSSADNQLVHVINAHEAGRRALIDGGPRFATMLNGRVSAIDFSPDGALLASASWDGTVRLWRMESGAQEAVLDHGAAILHDVKFSPDGAFIATAGEAFSGIWDVATKSVAARFEQPAEAEAYALAYSPDGTHVAAAYSSGDAIIYDAASGAVTLQTKIDGTAQRIHYSHDGGKLFVGGQASSMAVIDAQSGEKLWQAPTTQTSIAAASFVFAEQFGDRFLLTVGGNGEISLHDVITGNVRNSWSAGELEILQAVFVSEDETLITSHENGDIAVWNASLTSQFKKLDIDGYRQLAFSPSGGEAMIVDRDGGLVRYDTATRMRLPTPRAGADITAFAYLDDHRAITSGADMNIDVVDLRTGQMIERLFSNIEMNYRIDDKGSRWTHDDGRTLFGAITDDRKVIVVSPDSDRAPFFLPQEEDARICVLEIDSAGERLATLSHAGVFSLYETQEFSLVAQEPFEPKATRATCDGGRHVAMSADGKTVAAGADNAIRVWNAVSGQRIRDVETSFSELGALALSADNQTLYYSSRSAIAEIYMAALGDNTDTQTLAANTPVVDILAVNQNGALLITGGIDWSVAIHDAATGGFISSFVLEGSPRMVVHGGDANAALIGLGNGGVYLIDTPLSQRGIALSKKACAVLPPNRRFRDAELSDPFLGELLTESEINLCGRARG